MATQWLRELILDNSTVTMTLDEYKKYKKGKLTLCEIQDRHNVEREVNSWLRNPEVFKRATLITALLLMLEKKCMALDNLNGFEKQLQKLDIVVDKVMQIVYIIQTVGFVICLVMGLVEIIKSMINKDTSSIISIAIKYLLGFSSLFIFPYLLRLIFDILGYNGGILW